jgi:hypothetical protein
MSFVGDFFNRLGRYLTHMALLFYHRDPLPLYARDYPLTNLKSPLIIRLSKGQAVDGKPETHGGDEKDWGMRVSKQEPPEAPNRCVSFEAGCEKWSTVISYFLSCSSMPNMSASSAVILIRYCVISGRIRPNVYSSSCPHFHLTTQLLMVRSFSGRFEKCTTELVIQGRRKVPES